MSGLVGNSQRHVLSCRGSINNNNNNRITFTTAYYFLRIIVGYEKTELNNSSQDNREMCGLNPNDFSSHRVSHTEQNLVESNSGRRLEAVEVLKQKYINNDIQDLPR